MLLQCQKQVSKCVPAMSDMHSSVTAEQLERSSFRSSGSCASTQSAPDLSPVQKLSSRLRRPGRCASPFRLLMPPHWLRLRLCSRLKATRRSKSLSRVLY